MATNPVAYAEDTLGVHVVWEEAQQRLADHDVAKSTYLEALKDVRWCKSAITERTAELLADQRGLHSAMKVTEFREHMKVTLANDELTQNAERKLESAQADCDRAKAEMDHHELGVKATVARMTELGGLLQFYAVAKQAQIKA